VLKKYRTGSVFRESGARRFLNVDARERGMVAEAAGMRRKWIFFAAVWFLQIDNSKPL